MSYRFFPAPRPSLKPSTGGSYRPQPPSYCSCNPPCNNGEGCNSSRTAALSADPLPYPPQPPSPHVHFLSLCQTYLVDYDYDRSSTVVTPNDCALPARGCPGKTYFNTVASAARQGRRLGRCATPAASRGNSRTRNNNMSPPPSPSFYTKHILYPDEYPLPSPIPSPRAGAPHVVSDLMSSSTQSSDDSDAGLCTPPDALSQAPTPPTLSRKGTGYPTSYSGSQLPIDAPGHPPIPGLVSPSSPRGGMSDMFAITNALNGLELNGMGMGGGVSNQASAAANGLMLDGWTVPGTTAYANGSSPKKVKTKKSKTSLGSGVAEATRRARLAANAPWTPDQGVLGGF